MQKIIPLLALALLCAGCSTQPRNLTFVKRDLTAYHQDRYPKKFAAVADRARNYLVARMKTLPPGKNPAIVFDIDETSLSNWPDIIGTDYSMVAESFYRWAERSADPVNLPVLAIYQEAQKHGVAVFFITGRPEFLRKPTARNLTQAGYTNRAGLYMRPQDYHLPSIVPFKSASRRAIEEKGYTILLSIGDQWSDLRGGCAERLFKLPNPFYYIP